MKSLHFNVWRWVPIGTSILLIVIVAIISRRTMSELNRDTAARERTFKVLLDAQELEDKLVDAESGVRRYAESGQANLLVEFRSDTNAEARDFKELNDLTRGDPAQQKRLKALSGAIQAFFEYDKRVIGVYASQGGAVAQRMEDSPQGQDMEDTALKDLEDFSADERQLLEKTDSTERQDYHVATEELVFGSLLAAALLTLATVVVGREMARRREAEAKQQELIGQLQRALAEVKTLSGLIPICGWCHNVRSDTGFWQTVEQYVQAHTDAKMTHGICPVCAQKMESEMKLS